VNVDQQKIFDVLSALPPIADIRCFPEMKIKEDPPPNYIAGREVAHKQQINL